VTENNAAITLKPLISQVEIKQRVRELAKEISRDYAGANRDLVVVGILKGAWIFLADLVRELTVPAKIDFMTVSSYGASTKSLGVVKIILDLKCSIAGKDVLVVEDIIDTGLTLKYIIENLSLRHPRSLKLCVLLDKPARRQVKIEPDYRGFVVPDCFVVGYGVDFAERFRHLPYIGYIEEIKE